MKKMTNLLTILFCMTLPELLDCKILKQKPSYVILLNGTSSAGKSTLVDALHDFYPDFFVAKVDDYTRSHYCVFKSTRYLNFYKFIKEKIISGKNILVDTVLYHKKQAKYDALLTAGSTKLIKILVYCPLDCLVAHVQKRNLSGNALEHRSVNQSFRAFLSLYTMSLTNGTKVIDKLHSSAMKNALTLAMESIAKTAEKRRSHQEKTNKKVFNQFDLEKSRTISISPKHQWDFIVNTSVDSPHVIAQRIVDFVESKYGKIL